MHALTCSNTHDRRTVGVSRHLFWALEVLDRFIRLLFCLLSDRLRQQSEHWVILILGVTVLFEVLLNYSDGFEVYVLIVMELATLEGVHSSESTFKVKQDCHIGLSVFSLSLCGCLTLLLTVSTLEQFEDFDKAFECRLDTLSVVELVIERGSQDVEAALMNHLGQKAESGHEQ